MDNNQSTSNSNNLYNDKKNKVICPEMCYYCFDILIKTLDKSNKDITPQFTNDSYPLFVTWKIGKDQHLRGCIGKFSALSLHEGLADYAVISSMQDSRFKSVHKSEVKNLHCAVSLLTNFEDAKNYLDWQVGLHGIRIHFSDKKQSFSATYLPEVAAEQEWTQEETLDSLIRKSGYKGPINQQIYDRIELERYQSEKMQVSYADYLSARN